MRKDYLSLMVTQDKLLFDRENVGFLIIQTVFFELIAPIELKICPDRLNSPMNILLVFGKFSKKLGLIFLGFSTFFRIFDISPRLNTPKSL